ncbi:beta-1,3-galactosyltransferase 5-like [Ornithodoros turicata]|uniref:beta-1,3-galactosyltransferase 5-like n=1 Tax=Ornithodoros turicata TaxID=34597 RepID=UPI003139AEC6
MNPVLGSKMLVLGYERRHRFLVILGLLMLSSLMHSLWYFASVLVDYPVQKISPQQFGTPAWSTPQEAYNMSALDLRRDPAVLVDRSDFRYLLSSNRCQGADDIFLVVFVHSAPSHFHKRRAVRETWGNATFLKAVTGETMVLTFMVGHVNDSQTRDSIVQESALHGDIVMGNFFDSYRNLTYKHIMGLKWVTYFCRNARYVLKTDDDVFIDLFQMTAYLREALGPMAPPNLMMCVLIRRPFVKRSQRSKWRVSFQEYRQNRYPPYCSGWGILMSPDVVFNLYRVSAGIPYFWVDDVLVSGILAKRIGLSQIDFGNHFAATKMEAQQWLSSDEGEPPTLMGHPDLDTEVVYRLWNKTKLYLQKTF